jgi:hypothetical protein
MSGHQKLTPNGIRRTARPAQIRIHSCPFVVSELDRYGWIERPFVAGLNRSGLRVRADADGRANFSTAKFS